MTRGRKPTPTHLKLVRGNPGKRALNKAEPKPEGDLQAPPTDLPADAVPFWNQTIADAPAGLLRKLDARVLVVWVVAAWLHSQAMSRLASEGPLLLRRGRYFRNPALMVLDRQAGIMLKAGAEMGFTPSSRTRVATGSNDPGGNNPFDDEDFR